MGSDACGQSVWWKRRFLERLQVEGRQPWKTTALIVGFTTAAAGIRELLDPLLEDRSPYSTFSLSIAAVSVCAGFRAGLLATAVGIVMGFYLFVELPGWFDPHMPKYYVQFGLVLAMGAGIAFLAGALRESKRLLATFMRHMPGGAWIKDLRGCYTYANPEVERLFNLRLEQLRGKADEDILPSDTARQLRQHDLQALAENKALQTTEVLPNPDGTDHHWIVSKFPLPGRSGSVTGVGGIAVDITERRRAELAIATLAHELRTPLSALGVGIDLIERQAMPENIRNVVKTLGAQSKNMARLVDDLLEMSRMAQGSVSIRKESLDMRDALTRAVGAANRVIEERKHQLRVDLPPAALLVSADPLRLQQIFTNLIINAAQYTDEGGEIRISLTRNDGIASVAVKDNGVGIAKDQQKRIFEPFAQITTEPKRSTSGLGLGLALAKTMIELHGGTIEVASEGLGRGSTFTVRLPLEGGSGVTKRDSSPSLAA